MPLGNFNASSVNSDQYYLSGNPIEFGSSWSGLTGEINSNTDLPFEVGSGGTQTNKSDLEVLSGSVITNNLVISGETIDFNDLEVKWGNLSGNVYDQQDLTPFISDVIVNGNLPINDFGNNFQVVNNAIEYYGCDIILKTGIYNTVEIPYKNRSINSGNGNIFIFILDQDDVTIGYQKLLVGTGGSNEGVLEVIFDTPININSAGIYQFVIGRRNFSSNTKRIDFFHKDINSSAGSVWIAYGNSNASLNTNDPSAIDWSTINKQNFNRIIKSLIYKS